MIAVIFEVEPKPGQKDHYLAIAARLKADLEKLDGFISVERFQSLTNDRKILSLSFFENEKSLEQWRNLPAHREAQAVGRQTAFADYRLRIAHVMRDYGMHERDQAPGDSRSEHG